MLHLKRKTIPFLLSLLCAFAITLLVAQEPALAQRRGPVKFSAIVTPASARPGETVRVTVTATVKEPYHIYSVVPVGTGIERPQETTLTVSGPGLTVVGRVIESTPKQEFDPNFNLTVGLHEGTPTFTQALTVAKDAKPAPSLPLEIKVRYMACNASQCILPKPVTVEAPTLAIESGEARAEFTGVSEEARAESAAPFAASGNILDASDQSASSGGLLGFVLTAFGAGLLALVTPCVFPMIPVTLAFFTKHAAGKTGGVVKLAGLYSLGIILCFTGIGAVLAATVGAAGANRLAANPWVNLVFAILFILFGLALLEVVELRPPASLQKLTAAGGGNTGSTIGVLFMGLTFVIAAFTCTAPFIGTILVAASTASTGSEWVRPIIGMASFAMALALPFFLLALFPSLLAKMPKSGAWLTTVKGVLGFVEFAAALKFLSNSDLVWQWKLITQPVFLALWAGLSTAAALWLLGVLRIGWGAPEGRATVARTVWSGVFLGVAAYCLWGLTGRPLQADLVAFLPPTGYGFGTSTAASAEQGGKLPFLESLDEALAQAKAENKPIFIDFTGYACTNCRWMEKNIFPVASVRAEMEHFVRVRLYTDGGKDQDKNAGYQETTFGDVALPLYGVLTPEGKPVAKSAGVTRDPQKFADFLRQGRERQSAIAVATGAGE